MLYEPPLHFVRTSYNEPVPDDGNYHDCARNRKRCEE